MKAVLLLLCVVFADVASQVVLSEIMFNPAESERDNEFVELYNCGDVAVDLQDWLLSDGQRLSSITAVEENCLLAPHAFAIILVKNYYENSLLYESCIPPDVLRLTVSSAQLGGYGLNNSTAETISLLTPENILVDSCTYSVDNEDGFSDEKIILCENYSENWANSLTFGGTPGFTNSVSPLPVDVALLQLHCNANISADDSLTLTFLVQNAGLTSVSAFELQIMLDQQTLLHQQKFALLELPFQQTCELAINLPPLASGEHQLSAAVIVENDMRAANDSLSLTVHVWQSWPEHAVVINEIFYYTDEKKQEWVELYNASGQTINLQQWQFADKNRSVCICDSAWQLQPDAYVVLCNTAQQDSFSVPCLAMSLPELNNSGDIVKLMDAAGNVIDSLQYETYWGGMCMRSLERRRAENTSTSSANWASCTAECGHTAGGLNSVSPKTHDASLHNISAPGKFVQGDDIPIKICVANTGREPLPEFSVRLYAKNCVDGEEAEIAQLYGSELAVNDLLLLFTTWLDAPAGLYNLAAILSCPGDLQPLNNQAETFLEIAPEFSAIVINEVMAAPVDNAGEWIEIYNASSQTIDLRFWQITDADSSEKIPVDVAALPLAPASFCVIGADASICDVVVKNFPSLANSGDAVYLFAGNGNVVDAMQYSAIQVKNGVSLERINPQVASTEFSNWNFCAATDGNTAGAANSIFMDARPSHAGLSVTPETFSPNGDGVDDFAAIHYQLAESVNSVNVKIYDMHGRLVRFLVNNAYGANAQTVFWDGCDDAGQRCRIGIYIIYLEALSFTLVQQRLKTTVVLAAPL